MPTTIAAWGNSSAVRIPASLLERAGLSKGSPVDLAINERGNIEVCPASQRHRRVRPSRTLSVEALFAGYEGDGSETRGAWPGDEMVGAELESWSL